MNAAAAQPAMRKGNFRGQIKRSTPSTLACAAPTFKQVLTGVASQSEDFHRSGQDRAAQYVTAEVSKNGTENIAPNDQMSAAAPINARTNAFPINQSIKV